MTVKKTYNKYTKKYGYIIWMIADLLLYFFLSSLNPEQTTWWQIYLKAIKHYVESPALDFQLIAL